METTPSQTTDLATSETSTRPNADDSTSNSDEKLARVALAVTIVQGALDLVRDNYPLAGQIKGDIEGLAAPPDTSLSSPKVDASVPQSKREHSRFIWYPLKVGQSITLKSRSKAVLICRAKVEALSPNGVFCTPRDLTSPVPRTNWEGFSIIHSRRDMKVTSLVDTECMQIDKSDINKIASVVKEKVQYLFESGRDKTQDVVLDFFGCGKDRCIAPMDGLDRFSFSDSESEYASKLDEMLEKLSAS